MSLGLLLAGIAHAGASPFQSCQITPENPEVSLLASPQEFAAAMTAEFQKISRLSELEIDQSLRCLEFEDQGQNDCGERLEYFTRVLPSEWGTYRKTLAQTRFSSAAILESSSGPYFNHDLTGAGLLWFSEVQSIEPLNATERLQVQTEWETQLRRIRVALKKGLETKMREDLKSRRGSQALGTMQEALVLMDQPNLGWLIRTPNPYLQNYFSHIHSMIFQLNQKRVIAQLGRHPLLGVLRKTKLDRTELIRGLLVLRKNLDRVRAEFSAYSKQGVDPRSSLSHEAGRDMLDFLGVAESTLSAHPELCGVANELMDVKQKLQWAKSLGLLAGTGALLFTAPMISVGGLIVLQAYQLTDSAWTAQGTAVKAFTNPQADLNFATVQDAYLDNGDLNTELMLSPLMLTGVSLFKFSKLSGFFNR